MTLVTDDQRRKTDPDEFDTLARHIQQHLNVRLSEDGNHLFETDAEGLYEIYLDSLPNQVRQYHTCHCCRRFIQRFGGLVTIDANGVQNPALWSDNPFDDSLLYATATSELWHAVARANITGVFVFDKKVLGTPEEGGFTHFSVTMPSVMVHKNRVTKPHEVAAQKRQDFGTLSHGLNDYQPKTVEKALTILQADALYRADRFVGPLRFLHDLHTKLSATKSKQQRNNLLWAAVASAPAGFCTPRSSMVGTLLDDIAAGLPFDDVKRRFTSKVAPEQYGRAQVAPKAGAIAAAEKLFAELGLAPSLERRYAQLKELPTIWFPTTVKSVKAETGSVFGHIKAKDAAPVAPDLVLPASTMTWEKFQRTVLPMALSIEAQVPVSSSRFAALVTAANLDAPPILQWDREEHRNPFSWYYASGIDAEIRRRVTQAGGQVENVDIRASLIWNNRNDLDLHCRTPASYHIYYGSRRDSTGGWLDVDMNVSGETTEPVENIRWSKGMAQSGRYSFAVWNFTHHQRPAADTPFRLELEVFGRVFHVDGVVPMSPLHWEYPVVEFDVRNGAMVGEPRFTNREYREGSGGNSWNLTPGQFVPVTGIVPSPNMWGDKPLTHVGRHIFWLLDGCRDTAKGIGRGFFTETLKSELKPVRAVLEAYNASATIAGAEEATACGLGMTDQAPWDLVLRVKTSTGTHLYKIDRWD